MHVDHEMALVIENILTRQWQCQFKKWGVLAE